MAEDFDAGDDKQQQPQIGQPAPNAQPIESRLSHCLCCGAYVLGVRFCARHNALDALDDEAFAELADFAYAVHSGERSDWQPHAADGMPVNHKRMMHTHPGELGLHKRPWQVDVGAINFAARELLDSSGGGDDGEWWIIPLI